MIALVRQCCHTVTTPPSFARDRGRGKSHQSRPSHSGTSLRSSSTPAILFLRVPALDIAVPGPREPSRPWETTPVCQAALPLPGQVVGNTAWSHQPRLSHFWCVPLLPLPSGYTVSEGSRPRYRHARPPGTIATVGNRPRRTSRPSPFPIGRVPFIHPLAALAPLLRAFRPSLGSLTLVTGSRTLVRGFFLHPPARIARDPLGFGARRGQRPRIPGTYPLWIPSYSGR